MGAIGDLSMYKQALHEQTVEAERLDRGVDRLQTHATLLDAQLVAAQGRARTLLYACVLLVLLLAGGVLWAHRRGCFSRGS